MYSKDLKANCTLADLFQDRSQLAVYHFMLAPDSDHVCKGCSFVADHIDAARQHFGDADLSFAAISRAPLERIEQVKRALGWTFPWVSSHGSDFNFDFGVSFGKADIAAGRASFNYGTSIRRSEDMMGASIFARDESGEVFHTYSTFARGIENLMGTFMWLDLTPKGRHQFDDHRSRLSEDGLRDARKDDHTARPANSAVRPQQHDVQRDPLDRCGPFAVPRWPRRSSQSWRCLRGSRMVACRRCSARLRTMRHR